MILHSTYTNEGKKARTVPAFAMKRSKKQLPTRKLHKLMFKNSHHDFASRWVQCSGRTNL
jgi:hypothetical protein